MNTTSFKKFKIKSMDSKLFFWVYVYEDIKKMRKHANTHDKKMGHLVKHNDAVGVTHCYSRIIQEDGKEDRPDNNIGIIRITKDRCATLVVAHEVIHAALWQYRMEFGTENMLEGSSQNADFGTGCNPDEEQFAYIYGELFENMTKKMYKYKYWR